MDHERFNNLTSGIQSLVITDAVIVGGLWCSLSMRDVVWNISEGSFKERGIPMQTLPIYHFVIVDRDRQIQLRYSGLFVPRVGDTIELGGFHLKVVDVIVTSAQGSDGGVQHALYVHVKETKKLFDASEYQELELNEFYDLVKKNSSRTK